LRGRSSGVLGNSGTPKIAQDAFELLKKYLEKLDDGNLKIGFVTNKFEFLLMKTLGYEMSLEKLRSFGRTELNNKLKAYVRDAIGEDFKSLRI